MDISARFDFEKVVFDKENDVNLVVSLKAPKKDWEKNRAPICILPVVDVSGSMSGDRIDYVRKSLYKLVDHLQPGDFMGLVTFTTDVRTICKIREVTETVKASLKAEIGKLQAESSTNFAGGMLEGLKHLNQGDLPANLILRAIMFTDGAANCGPASDADGIVSLLTANLGKATVSAFGYGSDCRQELLQAVARAGKGNYAFIKNPDDAASAFAKELGGLLSTYAQNLELNLRPHNGHRITKTVSDVDAKEDGKRVIVKIPDILASEERHLVFKMELTEQTQALPRELNVVEVTATYDMIEADGTRSSKTENVKAKILFVKKGEEQEKATPEVDKIVGLAQLIEAQIEAEKHARAGQYHAASARMDHMQMDFESRGLGLVAAAAAYVSTSVSGAQEYKTKGGILRSMQSGGTRGYGTSGLAKEAEVLLSNCGSQLTNDAQNAMVQNFTTGGNPMIQANPLTQAIPPIAPIPPAPAPAKPKVEKKSGVSKSRSQRW